MSSLASRLGAIGSRPTGARTASNWGRPGGGWVDLHPLELGPAGGARQAALDRGWHDLPASFFTMGRINEVAIPCVSVEAQRLLRAGYELRPEDHHVALLDGTQAP
jgi:hypothetical protein